MKLIYFLAFMLFASVAHAQNVYIPDVNFKMALHKDFAPILESSEVHLDLEVLKGKLENFEMLQAMSDYFSDSQLRLVVFDTLENHIDFRHGVLNIPNMSISSNLSALPSFP